MGKAYARKSKMNFTDTKMITLLVLLSGATSVQGMWGEQHKGLKYQRVHGVPEKTKAYWSVEDSRAGPDTARDDAERLKMLKKALRKTPAPSGQKANAAKSIASSSHAVKSPATNKRNSFWWNNSSGYKITFEALMEKWEPTERVSYAAINKFVKKHYSDPETEVEDYPSPANLVAHANRVLGYLAERKKAGRRLAADTHPAFKRLLRKMQE